MAKEIDELLAPKPEARPHIPLGGAGAFACIACNAYNDCIDVAMRGSFPCQP
jgi:hypothetical protein